MNAPYPYSGAMSTARLSGVAALMLLLACANAGQRAPGQPGGSPASADAETAHPDAGRPEPRGGSHFVLTAAEIEKSPGIMNAYQAVQSLRPHFFRIRGPISLGAGRAAGQTGGRRGRGRGQGQAQGGGDAPQPSAAPRRGDPPTGVAATADDPGIIVYLDRQRLGRVSELEDIPVAIVDEIRLLNVAEANTRFGRGHPHGVILVTTRAGTLPPE